MWSCFFGTTPASFYCGALLSFFLFFLGFLNARLPRWPDFRGGSHGVSWPSRGSWSLTWETIAYPPPAPDQSRRSLFDLDKHLHVPSAWFHFAFKSLCHLPFTTRCAYVCVWVSTHVCSLFMCTVCVCDYVCTCVFSYPCWYKLVTALAWTSLGVSAFFFFFFFNLNVFFFFFFFFFLPWIQERRIQPRDSRILIFFLAFTRRTTLDFSSSYEWCSLWFNITDPITFAPTASNIADQLQQEEEAVSTPWAGANESA